MGAILPLLPVASWAALTLLLARAGYSRRDSLAMAAVGCGLFVVAVNELLSPPRLLTRCGVAAAWAALLAMLLAALYRRRGASSGALGDVKAVPPGKNREGLTLLVALSLILLVLAIIAVTAPPNNWDSMVYHMSRVAHWEQNRSVWHYPTNIQRQLFMPPGAEWCILHLQLLAGGDRFANFVQWASLAGSVVLVSRVAGLLGAAVWGQAAAAVAAGTIPMAVLQGSGTQNDLVCAFWLLCGVSLGLGGLLAKEGGNSPAGTAARADDLPRWFAVASSIGLALLTKGTAYLYTAPLFALPLLFRAAALARHGGGGAAGKRMLPTLALFACVPLAINAGHFARNAALTGSPLGPSAEMTPEGSASYLNANISYRTLVSNLIRNVANQMELPDPRHLTGWERLDAWLSRRAEGDVLHPEIDYLGNWDELFAKWLHHLARLDPDNPDWTWPHRRFLIHTRFWNHWDYAGSTLHVLLLACALILRWPAWPLKKIAGLYGAALLACFCLFSLVFRWQEWGNRLVLPLLVLAAPLLGVLLEKALPKWAGTLVAVTLLVQAVPYLVHNSNRPLFGEQNVFTTPRERQYFFDWPKLYNSFSDAAAAVTGDREVGLDTDNNSWEYPVWQLVRLRGGRPRIEHVRVTLNDSKRLLERPPFLDFSPANVIVLRSTGSLRLSGTAANHLPPPPPARPR